MRETQIRRGYFWEGYGYEILESRKAEEERSDRRMGRHRICNETRILSQPPVFSSYVFVDISLALKIQFVSVDLKTDS